MIAASANKTSALPGFRVGDERLIKVTESAAKKVSTLLQKQGRPQGCCAWRWWGRLFGIAIQDGFAGRAGNRDILVETGGIKVVVDPKSALYVTGSELDYLTRCRMAALKEKSERRDQLFVR